VLSLPASAIYVCDEGWPRLTMAAITLGLLAALVVVVIAMLFEQSLDPQTVAFAGNLMLLLPWGLLASQLAANYLAGVRPKK
jgi:hypothetical protein